MEIVEEFYIVICFAFLNASWGFVIAWLLQEGGGALCEDKCLGNKRALFCQSWKMVLALHFFSTFKEVQENCWHLQKRKIWFMMTSCITQANLFRGRLFFFLVCCNKETVNHSWRSIGSDSSPSIASTPPPLFPVLWFFRGLNIDVSYRRRF